MSGGVFKNIYSKNVLQIIIETSVTEFIFSKVPCFQHMSLNLHTFLKTVSPEVWKTYFGLILFWTFKQHSGRCLKPQKPRCKNFWWNYIEKERLKSYWCFDRTCILVLRVYFLSAWSGVQVKLRVRKIEFNKIKFVQA